MSSNKIAAAVQTSSRRQLFFYSWTRDVLIYVVVLNLFVEYLPKVVIDSFTVSILTAILLKALLDLILRFEHRVAHFFKARPGNLARFLRIISTWLILFVSKFVILEAEDLIFGEHVELGTFVHILALVMALMVAREVVRRIFLALGSSETTLAESY